MGSDLLTFYLEQQNRQTMEGCYLLVNRRRHCRDWLRIIIIDHHMDGSWNIIIIIMSPALSAGFVSVLNVFFTLRTTLEIELSWFIALVVFWFSLFKTVKIDSTFEIENDNKLASAWVIQIDQHLPVMPCTDLCLTIQELCVVWWSTRICLG